MTHSPLSPSRVKVVALPVGKIRRSRFTTFFDALTRVNEVRLGDVSPDPRPNRNLFSPQAFPDGTVFYEFATAVPPQSHLQLSPFEIFREPLVIIGIGDAAEYRDESSSTGVDAPEEGASSYLGEFEAAIASLKEEYARVPLHKVILFDFKPSVPVTPLPEDVMSVPPQQQWKTTTIKTLMCDVTSALLGEMTTLAQSIKGLPTVASPSAPQYNGPGFRLHEDLAPLSRSNSGGGISRSGSPADGFQAHRMSMPVLPSSNFASGGDSPTPESGYHTPPAKTFDEIASNEQGLAGLKGSRALPANQSRDPSRDRVSVHGFGPGSINERNRNKGKCRVGIVIGSLYLQAGRWHDAFRDLADGAVKARSYSDHLWQAKSLENLMSCMLLLAWSGATFEIPPVCYPVPERPSSSKSGSSVPQSPPPDPALASRPHTDLLRELRNLLPDMINMIISIYARSGNFSGEPVPQLVFSEFVIRSAKILTAINLAGGVLSKDVLQHVVRDTPLEAYVPDLSITRASIHPSRSSIADLLLRAIPESSEQSGITPLDQVLVLAGIASAFSTLGFQRKKAMLMKEYLSALTQALVQAKKQSAAEAGIHPSANLTAAATALAGEAESGIEEVLNLLCQVYGIPESKWSRSIGSDALLQDPSEPSGRQEATIHKPAPLPEQLVGNFVLRFFGSINVKTDVLKTCIELCEALPDFHGILHYTSALLRTAGPGIAPSTDTSDVLVTLSKEEQILLANRITKTVADGRALGLRVEAEYWDEFLVRGIYLVRPEQPLVLHPHRRSDAEIQKKAEKRGPFIHNPFLEKREAKAENLLVAGDTSEFVVLLQNPYDFDVDIEHIKLIAEDECFASAQNLALKPYRTQSFSVSGIVSKTGELFIDSCTVKVKGCRERSFPIFSEPWAPQSDIKLKSVGLLKAQHPPASRPTSDASIFGRQTPARSFPIPSTVSLAVIPAQPSVTVSKISLPQSALMLLEGEQQTFAVSFQNTSTTPADFIYISFRDSVSTAIQEALTNKTLSPAELYELEYQLTKNPAIRLRDNAPESIAPGATETFTFEVVGKPGLITAEIQLDYAHLSTPHTKNRGNFFSRSVSVPIAITVNAAIQLHRLEIVPVASEFSWKGLEGIHPFYRSPVEESCLLLVDLRNSWPEPLDVCLHIRSGVAVDNERSSSAEIIAPGHTVRFALQLPKIHLANPYARINSLNERQFVVSSTGLSLTAERSHREVFWFREELLRMLSGDYMVEGEAGAPIRSGEIDFRSVVRLNPRMVDVLRLPDVAVKMSVSGDGVREKGGAWSVPVDGFVTLRVELRNRANEAIHPLLRLRPAVAHQPPEVALELGKRFAWSGVLQSVLPPVEPGGVEVVELGICALAAGEYEIGAVVEEVVARAVEQGDDVDPVALSAGRGKWVFGRACRIVAIEG
ncbi:Trs120-domain-containing protein [Trichodelitschia bisporula]|uniref:Trs120-domain-containing protein n=1 Tax=Trichodelitschia bisporula TaxID=703511 RepID=A0A6G1HN24_9PEZI|nr:Trs120-domain-containing protein [Trichodelitschia bisporula]